MASVISYWTQGPMRVSLPTARSGRVIVEVHCDSGDTGDGNWGAVIGAVTSLNYPTGLNWGTDPSVMPVEVGVSSTPTLEVSDVDLLYPANWLDVQWRNSVDPAPAPATYEIRAWVVHHD